MEENSIRNYAALMRDMGLTGLEIEENGMRVRMERNPGTPAPETVAIPVESVPAVQAELPKPEVRASENLVEVRSPMVGMFYSSSSESAEPFVHVGTRVKKGDVLCIIEAMKLMNEIEADTDGEIAEVCVGNSQIVDYGHVLFRIKRS